MNSNITLDDTFNIGIFPNKKVKSTIPELVIDYTIAIPLIKKNLNNEIKFLKNKINKMLSYRSTANETTLGFLDEIEDEHMKEINKIRLQLKLLEPRDNTTNFINKQDISFAKQIPISNFLQKITHNKTLCIFHADKVPSLHIYNDKTYYCFVCHESGDVISLIMKLRNCNFTSAVKYLINK